jgi:RNA polymerase subunit RPABC4/transcription elongation factor Spt4
MILDPSNLSTIVLIATAFTAAFLAALWLSLLVWIYRDVRRRSRDPLAAILAVLVVAVLFLPGIIIYLILRPSQTIEEEYENTLHEEALLQSIEDAQLCPACGRRTRKDWVACPYCHTKIKENCRKCRNLLDPGWTMCPYCGTPTEDLDLTPPALDPLKSKFDD